MRERRRSGACLRKKNGPIQHLYQIQRPEHTEQTPAFFLLLRGVAKKEDWFADMKSERTALREQGILSGM